MRGNLKTEGTSITALLGLEPLTEIALECWAGLHSISSSNFKLTLQDNETLIPADTTRLHSNDIIDLEDSDSSILERIEGSTKQIESMVNSSVTALNDTEKDPSIGPSGISQIHIIGHLAQTIEVLFDILPAIRSVRRDDLLGGEREQLKEQPPESVQAGGVESESAKSAAIPASLAFEQRLDHSLDLASGLETLLRNDENWAAKNGQKIELFTPIIRKERERLAGFKNAKTHNEQPAKIDKLLRTISGLEKALSATMQEVEIKGKLGEKQYTGSTQLSKKIPMLRSRM
jgi:hypothetical protein